MNALDTNVLVRFLVKDDKRQAEAVYRIFKQAEIDKDLFFIPLLVVLETLWVLDAVYQISKSEILNAIDDLLSMPILKFERQSAVRNFLLRARDNNVDLADILIASSARLSGCEKVLTFDKKASNLDLFELII